MINTEKTYEFNDEGDNDENFSKLMDLFFLSYFCFFLSGSHGSFHLGEKMEKFNFDLQNVKHIFSILILQHL